MSANNIIAIGLAVALGIGLVLGIQYFLKQREKRFQPKTGFLGKALMQLSLVMVLLTGIAGAYFLSTGKIELISQANKEVKTAVNYRVLTQDSTKATVEFAAIPSVGDKDWGEKGDSFDIFWNIRPDDKTEAKGQENFDYVETSRTKTSPSKFTTTLLKGSYKIKLVVSYKGESFETHQDIVL